MISDDSCSFLITINTTHMSTFPLGEMEYIEFPVTTIEHPQYQNNDLNQWSIR